MSLLSWSNNEIILGVNTCNIPRVIQVIVDCFIRDGIDMENVVAKRMINICKHVQVRNNDQTKNLLFSFLIGFKIS